MTETRKSMISFPAVCCVMHVTKACGLFYGCKRYQMYFTLNIDSWRERELWLCFSQGQPGLGAAKDMPKADIDVLWVWRILPFRPHRRGGAVVCVLITTVRIILLLFVVLQLLGRVRSPEGQQQVTRLLSLQCTLIAAAAAGIIATYRTQRSRQNQALFPRALGAPAFHVLSKYDTSRSTRYAVRDVYMFIMQHRTCTISVSYHNAAVDAPHSFSSNARAG